ncbi:hypothetical protein [Ligilactobacillus apodemi]|uniref:Uncharacterized protein n=1 Tax=Ligilactobacillus apodemi DSM 16634 = JCM 16172 TaxID=1423724 RepID=A0A0R1U153_9LACO|nr:hypothetical protein [Ligilactobacillus apodemi]KRL84578.1 hypothetical protein FC32_GL000469 [Ligilactobacillus apodemi DSM 16634 = JCM 16172]MCR1900832.1 hypothetical protein [Ligilactobacillus apodemi]
MISLIISLIGLWIFFKLAFWVFKGCGQVIAFLILAVIFLGVLGSLVKLWWLIIIFLGIGLFAQKS